MMLTVQQISTTSVKSKPNGTKTTILSYFHSVVSSNVMACMTLEQNVSYFCGKVFSFLPGLLFLEITLGWA